METTENSLIYWSNIVGASSLVLYSLFLLLQVKGFITPSPFWAFIARIIFLIAFITPVASRLILSGQTIMFLALILVGFGVLAKIRRIMGV